MARILVIIKTAERKFSLERPWAESLIQFQGDNEDRDIERFQCECV